jgi:hypothetical protein
MYVSLTMPEVIASTVFLIGVWGCVTSLEWIAAAELFRSGGVFDARVVGLSSTRRRLLAFSKYPAERTMLALFLVRLLASASIVMDAVLFFSLAPGILLVALIYLLASTVFTMLRAGYGGDGSDQMGVVVLLGLALVVIGVWTGSDLTMLAGAVLNAGQLTIAYCVSGVSKWMSPIWRSGVALVGVMGTHTYGHGIAADIVARSPGIPLYGCWLIFVTESLFPLALFLPPMIFQTILICFLVFHFMNAFFMGLNAFVWSFSACYPAMIFLQLKFYSFVFS